MALTQIQIIQSLGESMAWFERELNWGVPPTEMRHLVGRIGELYAALISNGQMATAVNPKGYDVVGSDGQRISVKTTAMMGSAGHVAFNPNTISEVDRVMILRINTAEMQIEVLLDSPVKDAGALMSNENSQGKTSISLSKLVRPIRNTSELKEIKSVSRDDWRVRELENGTIEVYLNERLVSSAISELRKLADTLNLSTLNSNGNPYNTRQLGSLVIKAIQSSS
ncbi:MAG: hypothetical protein DHS20C09_11980 [marine bacterium B5-7]|nr:MAG: hypothetical protein DHS20C09_11980 [marine bacterium B5-7]